MNSKEINLGNLKNNIWKTRKARINLAERLNNQALFIKILNVYYSCIIIGLNLWDIYNNKYDFTIILLTTSIILTILITFFDSQQYSQRSENIKKCYIDLQKLYNEMNNENLSSKSEEYYMILKNTENHSEYDYYKMLINIKEASLFQKLKYYLHAIIINSFKFLLILLPVIFVYFAIFYE